MLGGFVARLGRRCPPSLEAFEPRVMLSSSTPAKTAAGRWVAAPAAGVSLPVARIIPGAGGGSGVARTAHPALSRSTRQARARTPVAPTQLSATVQTPARTLLTWTAGAAAPTGTSYVILRSQGVNGPWVPLATLSATATSYLDRHGAAAGVYSYRVQAVNGTYASAFSNTATSDLAYAAPIVITQGGTYTGNWQSLDGNTPAVLIETDQPVTITNSNVRSAGPLIEAQGNAEHVTVANTTGYGLNPGIDGYHVGRFLDATGWASVTVTNCSLNNTSGIYLANYTGDHSADDTVKVLRNNVTNVDGRQSDGNGGWLAVKADPENYRQFFQLNEVNGLTGAEIAWNQVINNQGASRVEESINLNTSSGTPTSPILIHDNYVQGAYPGNPADFSRYTGGGIMASDNGTDYVSVFNNQVVATGAIGIGISSGHDNAVYGNRVISSGKMPDGTATPYSNVGIVIWNYNGETTFTNNVGYGNVIGWVGGDGTRNDFWVPDASKWTGNVSLPDPITPATEAAEFTLWQTKLFRNRVSIGVRAP